MNLRSAISAPLPWLALLTSIFFGKKPKKAARHTLIRLPRTLSFTREGIGFIIVLFLVGIAAINTGNNMLYLVVAMLLSLIIISGIMSELTLRNITIKRSAIYHIFAGKQVLITWKILSGKRYTTSYSFIIEELPVEEMTSSDLYTLKFHPKGAFTRNITYIFNRRGLYSLKGFKISTRFPFGLFTKGREESFKTEVLVFPRIKPLKRYPPYGIITGDYPQRKNGIGSQPYTLRDYNTADDARLIHWKSTAKSSKLLAKEFEKEGNKKVLIVLQNHGQTALNDRFEELVEYTASLANYLINKGYSVGLKTMDMEVPCRDGKKQLYAILRTLAIVKYIDKDDVTPSLKVIEI
jgi:uncharacterized protein (DUF58 family)